MWGFDPLMARALYRGGAQSSGGGGGSASREKPGNGEQHDQQASPQAESHRPGGAAGHRVMTGSGAGSARRRSSNSWAVPCPGCRGLWKGFPCGESSGPGHRVRCSSGAPAGIPDARPGREPARRSARGTTRWPRGGAGGLPVLIRDTLPCLRAAVGGAFFLLFGVGGPKVTRHMRLLPCPEAEIAGCPYGCQCHDHWTG